METDDTDDGKYATKTRQMRGVTPPQLIPTVWRKGQVTNPHGRPKRLPELVEAAREHTAEALATLLQIATDRYAPPAARVSAAVEILNRGWGRPAMFVGLGIAGDPFQTERLQATLKSLEGVVITRNGEQT